jgi:hypothetical protein
MDRKAMLRAYKEKPPPMGIYAVRNTADSKWLIGASANVSGRLNREKFALDFGNHPSRALQADFNRLGGDAFTFEVLDTLDPSDDPDADAAEELAELLSMWLDRLALPQDRLYPQR